MPRKKSPLEPRVRKKRAYELPNLINVQTPPDPIRQIENEALRDLSNEYRTLRIEEMLQKKRKQMAASGPMSNTQAQRENLEYFKTVMDLAKMNQPKEGPDQTLEYLKFFNQMNLQNQQLNAPSSFFDQYVKAREMGIVGNPATGEHNTFSVELEKIRGERMLRGKKHDLSLYKLQLEQEARRDNMGLIGQILGPVLAVGGNEIAKRMHDKGVEMGERARNPFNPTSQMLQGETAKLEIQCDCGFSEALLVPVPPPATVACPGCGKILHTGPPPLDDLEVNKQWQRQT